jgi:hypothetical protein
VDRPGCYFLNGRPASLEELQGECARLARIGGVVAYNRENPKEEAPKGVEAVIDAIAQARLPVTFAPRDYDAAVRTNEYFK